MDWERKIVFHDIEVPEHGKCHAVINLSLKDRNGVTEFTACGEIWEGGAKDCFVCGQCINEIANCVNDEKVRHIERLWKRWHLNTLHAGCEHQRSFEKEPYQNHALEVCPHCGHKYGSDWQTEIIPDEVIEEIKSIK